MIALVVEREWDTRESLRKKLERRGYIVHAAESAEEAMNLCTALDVDLVLAASALPEMTGLELLERIVEGRKDLSVSGVILMAKQEDAPAVVKSRLGNVSFVNKPVLEEKLKACLDPTVLSSEAGL